MYLSAEIPSHPRANEFENRSRLPGSIAVAGVVRLNEPVIHNLVS